MQSLRKSESSVGHEFEREVCLWIKHLYQKLGVDLWHSTRLLSWEKKYGISGNGHEFDCITCFSEKATRLKWMSFLVECKTLHLKNLVEKKTIRIAQSMVLDRNQVEDFLVKCYDCCPESFFRTFTLERTYPVLVSSKPLSEEAFRFAFCYGITVLQPSLRSFTALVRKIGERYDISVSWPRRSGERLTFFPPIEVIVRGLGERLSSGVCSATQSNYEKKITDLIKFRDSVRRSVGLLPQRCSTDRLRLYRRFLDIVKEFERELAAEGRNEH